MRTHLSLPFLWKSPKKNPEVDGRNLDLVPLHFLSRKRAGKTLPGPELAMKKEQKCKTAVFFEFVLPSLTRKTSQGK